MGYVKEFRIALTAQDFDKSLSFYHGVLGLPVVQEWPSQEGRGILLSLSTATLEIVDRKQAAWIDRVEVGRRVSGPVRFALKVTDLAASLRSAAEAGARVIRHPVMTPWDDLNARILGPDGMQVTLFNSPRGGVT